MELYAINLLDQVAQEQYKYFFSLASKETQKRISKFHFQDDAKRTLYGEILIRYLVCKELKISNNKILFDRNKYGKPFLMGYPFFQFNISHSENWIICAIDKTCIGVDVECMKPIDNRIAKRFFTDNECHCLRQKQPKEQLAAFYDLWTAKESYLKYIGTGLSKALNTFTITNNEKNNAIVEEDLSCTIHISHDLVGYAVSVCYCTKNILDFSIKKIDVGGILNEYKRSGY